MAKQTINIGSSVNKGDGDPLRTAFDKINDNFDELYTDTAALEDSVTPSFTIITADDYVASNGERIVVPAAYPGSADILGFLNPVAGNWFVVVNGKTTGSSRVDPEGTGSSYVTVADQTTATFVYDGTEWNYGVN